MRCGGTSESSGGRLPGLVCHGILSVYQRMGNLCLRLPGSVLTIGNPDPWKVLIYYLTLALHFFFYIKRNSVRNTGESKNHSGSPDGSSAGAGEAYFLHCCCCACIIRVEWRSVCLMWGRGLPVLGTAGWNDVFVRWRQYQCIRCRKLSDRAIPESQRSAQD